jgi:hypothetical protein
MTTAIIGASILAGLALALRFNALALVPALFVAVIGTAFLGLAHGEHVWFLLGTVILAATTIQIGYFVGALASDVFVKVEHPVGCSTDQYKPSMFKFLDVQTCMEVVGSDGEHVGVVDHKENADRIVLTKDDRNARGKPHLISIDWIDYIDSKIHLNKPSDKAISEWRIAA